MSWWRAAPARALTLTEPGAEDLRHRLAMHPETGGAYPSIFVGTFHQYANRILRDGGARSILGLSPYYSVWDQQRAVETLEVTHRLRQRDVLAALRWYGLNRARSDDSQESPARERRWRDVVEFHTSEKRRQHALDLDDLLVMAIQALEQDQGIRSRWTPGHLLVDQFEDIRVGAGLRVGAGVTFFVEGHEVTLDLWVPPPQSPVFPAQVQSQRVTVPVEVAWANRHDLDGLVSPSTSRSPARGAL